MTILGAEASTFHRRWLRERPDDYDPATRRALEMGEFMPATHYLLAQRARSLLRHRMANLRGSPARRLLSPTLPMPTVPLQDRFVERSDFRESRRQSPPCTTPFRQTSLGNRP